MKKIEDMTVEELKEIGKDEAVELTEKELAQIIEAHGLKVTQLDTEYFKEKGYLHSRDGVPSFIRIAEQIFKTVKLKINPNSKPDSTGQLRPYAGKNRRYIVKGKYDTIQEREDMRKLAVPFTRKKKYSKLGATCEVFQGVDRNDKLRKKLQKYFQTKRVTRKMFYAYYFGYDDMYFDENGNRLESTKYRPNQKKKEEQLYWHKYYVYRFIVNNKVTYVGLTGHLKYRMHGHKFKGHLKQEWYNSVDRIEYIELETEVDMNIAEIYFIAKLKPAWNSSRTYDKKLGITIEELDNLEWKTLDFSLKNII